MGEESEGLQLLQDQDQAERLRELEGLLAAAEQRASESEEQHRWVELVWFELWSAQVGCWPAQLNLSHVVGHAECPGCLSCSRALVERLVLLCWGLQPPFNANQGK